ncbi:hypothetical protein [Myxococcus qinghaiensis]|uniref:hypothetical protein n=1 Tax=Myxococcus qinghaiensis TaxID=2906758 RepID=UPI0020A6FDB0|nr:hypothetical protein [Myxococcus qinghaiensis]MCP3166040.1 hypothetical protein [Myxococcus qinghaiensis]
MRTPEDDSIPWGQLCDGDWEKEAAWPSLIPQGVLSVSYEPDFRAVFNGRRRDSRARCRYSRVLNSMEEPGLWPSATGSEVYRFTWMRSFEEDIAIRVERHGTVAVLHAKQLKLPSKSSDGASPLDVNQSRLLLPLQWAEFRRRLEVLSFWTRKSAREGTYTIYLDGSRWLLEGAQDGGYRAYDVFLPSTAGESGAFRDACLYLVELSGLSIPSRDVY